jgi:UDP-2,3-diacylglucosamine pyrophosphatase LpxH
MMKVLKYLESEKNLKEIVILGDYADIYNLSGHGPKNPAVLTSLIDEIEDVNSGLDEIDGFSGVRKIYIQGNHEYRFERYLTNKCPELFGVTEFHNLINIHKRPNWRYVNYGPNQKHKVLDSYLTARHEPLANSAKATASKALCSLVYGHIHRIEESHIVGLDGSNHVCFSVGWLGDKTQDLIYGYVKGHHQWQLGFGIVYVDEKTKYFYHEKIHIMDDYTCVVDGVKFSL